MLLSCLVVAEDIREAPFSLNYWSALYPFGVYALAFGQLAIDFDSPTFRTLNTIMTCSVSVFVECIEQWANLALAMMARCVK